MISLSATQFVETSFLQGYPSASRQQTIRMYIPRTLHFKHSCNVTESQGRLAGQGHIIILNYYSLYNVMS